MTKDRCLMIFDSSLLPYWSTMISSWAFILIVWNYVFLKLLKNYIPWQQAGQIMYIFQVIIDLGFAMIYYTLTKNMAYGFVLVTLPGHLLFWLQKNKVERTFLETCKCFGNPKVERSVHHQGTSTSTCCGSGVSQFLLTLSPPTSSRPQTEVNIEEELRKDYVMAFRSQYDEEDVSNENVVTAIRYLNTRKGGIAAHRKSESLMDALEHIDCMSLHLNDSGLPLEYSYKELRDLMVKEMGYLPEDFDRVLEKFCETRDFLPSPREFEKIYHDMKVHLEQKVAKTEQKMEETRQEMEETRQEMEETTQAVVKSRKKNLSLRLKHKQELQQKDILIQQMDRLLLEERQRLEELENTPEGELQKRLHELEKKVAHLSAQTKCKICMVEELQVSFSPCNHFASCQKCAKSLTEENPPPSEKICPVCRNTIKGTVRTFL